MVRVLRINVNSEIKKGSWFRTPDEVKEFSFQQVEWIFLGLKIEQKKAHQ